MNDSLATSVALLRDILKDDYLELRVERFSLDESLGEGGVARVRAVLEPDPARGEKVARVVEGEGVGLVDAVYHAFMDQFSSEYSSLPALRFIGFSVEARLDPNRPKNMSGADAFGEVTLVVANEQDREFEFKSSTRSITASALYAVLDAVSFFINSERAFILTRRALKDAQSRSRNDLVQVFAGRLAELVKNTSYSDVLERG